MMTTKAMETLSRERSITVRPVKSPQPALCRLQAPPHLHHWEDELLHPARQPQRRREAANTIWAAEHMRAKPGSRSRGGTPPTPPKWSPSALGASDSSPSRSAWAGRLGPHLAPPLAETGPLAFVGAHYAFLPACLSRAKQCVTLWGCASTFPERLFGAACHARRRAPRRYTKNEK